MIRIINKCTKSGNIHLQLTIYPGSPDELFRFAYQKKTTQAEGRMKNGNFSQFYNKW